MDIYDRYNSGRKRHLRRCANEIAKEFKCPYDVCGKIYGSEGSLNLHMKIKHNAGSKTEREKLAKNLVMSLSTNENMMSAAHLATTSNANHITLPPGLIEKTAKEIGVDPRNIEDLKKKAMF